MKPLPKSYDHKEAEPRLQKQWEESGVYAWDKTQPRENTFVIDTPPPTVSGILHMGHIFSYTQADFVARYQRMSGKTVFYPMGFDDNGLPTERLVEKEKKVRGSAMPREEFVALCREVVKGAEGEFRRLFKSTALSVDWKQEYQTISDDVRKLSQMSFLDLLRKGEAYRKLQPMLWDPVDLTAIAQAEIVDKEMPSHMNDIMFFVDGEKKSRDPLIIATTRPELLGACVAVFYHPDDERYRHLKGKTAITPLFGVKVPILEDDAVKMDKGTGLVMCCTFGDEADIHWWQKHNLPVRVILNKYGKLDFTLNTQPGESIQDVELLAGFKEKLTALKVTAAREAALALLKEYDVLVKQEPITHTVKCAERSGAPLEILPTHQWFVKVLDKKDALKDKAAQCNWHPSFMKYRIDQWIDGLSWDWCISRQRFFGIPFPVWYGNKVPGGSETYIPPFSAFGEEEIFAASAEQLPVDPLDSSLLPVGFKKIDPKNIISSQVEVEKNDSVTLIYAQRISDGQIYILHPDKDVMDTWATSSVSPQISAHGISKDNCADPARFAKLFPADLRPQAHEIIRTWAFYTIVKAHLHSDDIPWHNLMISGWCLAADKSKMSKSKGNVVTPVDLIIDKGADVVRYWASTSRLGADTAFSEDLLKIGKKLVTKLWNATSFVAIHLDKIAVQGTTLPTAVQEVANGEIITETLDKWILSRLHKTIAKATQEFEHFEYCDARVAVEEFFWKDFCDNYLELVKARAYGEEGSGDRLQASGLPEQEPRSVTTGRRLSAHLTLFYCLDAILRLFAPFLPHVTEELFGHIFDKWGSVHARGTWPRAQNYPKDRIAEESGMAAVSVLEAIRKAKSEKNVSIKFPIRELTLAKGSKGEGYKTIEPVLNDLKAAGNIESIVWSDAPMTGVETEDKSFTFAIEFAESTSAA